jgi:hypothetical protein
MPYETSLVAGLFSSVFGQKSELLRILTNPKRAVRELLKVCRTLCPFLRIIGFKIVVKNAGESL